MRGGVATKSSSRVLRFCAKDDIGVGFVACDREINSVDAARRMETQIVALVGVEEKPFDEAGRE